MLSKGSGEHVLCPRTAEEKIICGVGVALKGEYIDGTGGGIPPGPVGHILVSWRWRSLVPAGFSPHPAPCDIDGPVGSVRWPFSRLGFRSVRGWRTALERRTARG